MEKMVETTVVDKQGRVYLPKEIREKTGAGVGTILELKSGEKEIVLRPRESVVRRSRGAFKLRRPIKDVDKIIRERSYERGVREL